MESENFILQLVLILISARVVGEIAAYFNVPSVIGELLAGIIIGPSLLGIVDPSSSISLLAEIGIILLLFEVGLETDVHRLLSAGLKASIVALGGVILPFALGFMLSYWTFSFSLLASLFIGCTLTATSIGITLRVLKDLKRQNSREAQIIIGAAVIDDVIGIILLTLLYEFASSGEVNLFNAGKVMILITFFLFLAPVAAKIVAQVIRKWDERCEIPGLLPTTIISVILLFAWIAHALGAPELLGGFTAGLALSKEFPFREWLGETENFTSRVEKQMKPLVHLFSPIFFVSVGLSLNFKSVDWGSSFFWLLTGSLLFAGILGKLIAAFFLKGESSLLKLIIGIAMVPRGEVGLIFANVGAEAGIFEQETYAAIVLVIALTTLIPPFFLRWIYANKFPPEKEQPGR